MQKELTAEDKKILEAQELLSKIVNSLAPNHPLKDKAYIAGGAVRDEVMGFVPKDIDITVEAEDGGIKLAKLISSWLNIREPVIFPTYGTAQLMLPNGVEVEFVCTRKEQYHDESRKPDVSFGTLKEDVERRDFTVNSLLKSLSTGEILDLTGKGVDDIKNGVIRTPLNPDVIFSEDPLRMMRAVRFAVKYNWEMTDVVVEGIKRNVDRLEIISRERVRDEIDKIIGAKALHRAIASMNELSLLDKVFPEMHALMNVEQSRDHHSEGDAYVHTLLVVKNFEEMNPDSSIPEVLSALMHDWGKKDTQSFENGRLSFNGHEVLSKDMAEERMRKLKYPNDVVDKTAFLVRNHMRCQGASNWSDKAFRRFYREMGEGYSDVMKLMKADEVSSIPESGERFSNHDLIAGMRSKVLEVPLPPKPPINGHDIMSAFAVKGKQIGEIQKILQDLIDEDPSLARADKPIVVDAIKKSDQFDMIDV
jgi:tRNA nucleotidyltransferase/poly(A) polymerase